MKAGAMLYRRQQWLAASKAAVAQAKHSVQALVQQPAAMAALPPAAEALAQLRVHWRNHAAGSAGEGGASGAPRPPQGPRPSSFAFSVWPPPSKADAAGLSQRAHAAAYGSADKAAVEEQCDALQQVCAQQFCTSTAQPVKAEVRLILAP